MKFEPWDKLQLNGSITGGQRVRKNEVFYKLYRSYGQKIVWSPLFLTNGALFYGDSKEEVKTLVENLAIQNKEFYQSSAIHFYDFTDEWSKLEEHETSKSGFYYHPYRETIESFAENMIQHFNLIKDKMQEGRLTEPINKKIDIVLIHISKEDKIKLKNDLKLMKLLKDVIENGYKFRIYPILVSEKIVGIQPDLVKNLQWISFIGKNNMDISERIFSRIESGYRSINQKVIGTCYNKNNSNLLPIHPLKFTPSEWWLEKQKILEKEDKEYNKYLETLNDGT